MEVEDSTTNNGKRLSRLRRSNTTPNYKEEFEEEVYTSESNKHESKPDKVDREEGVLNNYLQAFSFKKDLARNRVKPEYTPFQRKEKPIESNILEEKPHVIHHSQSMEATIVEESPRKSLDKNETTEILMNLGKKKKVGNTRGSNNTIKNEIKERQISEVANYLFNYLKDPRDNKVTKGSLSKCLYGLSITSISDDQADKMLNFPNEDRCNLKKTLNLDEVKDIVRLCNFKFDADNRLI